VTIEDEGVFTTPWTSTLTYVPGKGGFPEAACAENLRWFRDREADVAKAETPDF
jgi:hypothetical protein